MDQQLRYTLDADMLDCPICTDPLATPVFQCQNGHVVCSSCCKKLTSLRCPSCTLPTGVIRCLVVEKVIESLQVSCKHAHFGCKEMLEYKKRAEREKHEMLTCKHMPVVCPHPRCTHEGLVSELSTHLTAAHDVKTLQLGSNRSVSFVMANSDDLMMVKFDGDGMMLVHSEFESFARDFFCSTISGASRVYKLKVQRRRGPGKQTVYKMKTSAPNILDIVRNFCHPKEQLRLPISKRLPPLSQIEYVVEVFIPASENPSPRLGSDFLSPIEILAEWNLSFPSRDP